jgi:hypothetical protein
MTVIPTEEQLAQIIDVKASHARDCAGRTWFDLSHYEIVVRCTCGFEYRTEQTEQWSSVSGGIDE